MERYSLIVVADETSPIRRFDIRKDFVRRGLRGAAIAACVLAIGLVDYVRVRVDYGALAELRAENAAQRAQIDEFHGTLAAVESDLASLRDFERKVRVIANLPGSAATGGEDVSSVGPATGGDLEAAASAGADVALPDESSGDEPEHAPKLPDASDSAAAAPPATIPAADLDGDRFSALQQGAERLGAVAKERKRSLADLVTRLEDKRYRLTSTPAIWPAKGWMTSRFGNRISPFTGARQFHAGIDIAGARGTNVIAPARGRVISIGDRGPMGRSITIDHGYGIRTLYGHADAVFVKRGQEIERGQRIASMGNTGRSTGPHLHYAVEVSGKAVNPLDYIFD